MKAELTRRIGLIAALGIGGLAFAYLQTPTSAKPTPVPAPVPASTPVPPPVEEPLEPKAIPRVDLANLGADDEVAIMWSIMADFHHSHTHILIRGGAPSVALVSKLNIPRATKPPQVMIEPPAKFLVRTTEVPFGPDDRAAFSDWLDELRGERTWLVRSGMTYIDAVKFTRNGDEMQEVRESFSNDVVTKSASWMANVNKVLKATP